MLLAPSLVLLSLAAPPAAQAGSRTLQVGPLISRFPSGPCPPSMRLKSRDAFSATWVAPLRPAYQRLRVEVDPQRGVSAGALLRGARRSSSSFWRWRSWRWRACSRCSLARAASVWAG